MAAKEIGLSNKAYREVAYHDLVKAAKLDESNKDIQRELQEARRAFFEKEKRKLVSPNYPVHELKRKLIEGGEEGEDSCNQSDYMMEMKIDPVKGRHHEVVEGIVESLERTRHIANLGIEKGEIQSSQLDDMV